MPNLVSILIPAHNSEKWINQTIVSALNQEWKKKEIIIVDDGSSDSTLEIAKEFESKSVKVITQENRGASAARNVALSLAQGDYIQWLDADDLLAPDKISQQLQDSESGRTSRILLSSAFGQFYFRHNKARFDPHSLWRHLMPVEWFLSKFEENAWMSPAVWLVSRRLTENAGPWDERLSLDDDGEYFSRVVAVSKEIKFVPEARSYYRRCNIDSLSRSVSDDACMSLFLSLSLCIQYLRELEDSERTRAASLNYLQTWLDYFYPDKHDLLQEIRDLAYELGGKVLTPQLGWKYSLIEKTLGWQKAKKFRNAVRKAKLSAYINWDRLLSKLLFNKQRLIE